MKKEQRIFKVLCEKKNTTHIFSQEEFNVQMHKMLEVGGIWSASQTCAHKFILKQR